MSFARADFGRRALPLAMLAVGLCLQVTGVLFATTLLIPGALYLAIGLRGLYVQRKRDAQQDRSRIESNGASGHHA